PLRRAAVSGLRFVFWWWWWLERGGGWLRSRLCRSLLLSARCVVVSALVAVVASQVWLMITRRG
ncbi:MAG: hypothetical protein ACREMQ_20180, partial [Longimicrobiales bacterium]